MEVRRYNSKYSKGVCARQGGYRVRQMNGVVGVKLQTSTERANVC